MKSEMGRRKGRNTDDFFLMNVVGIARESAAIILQHFPLFLSIAVVLVSPVSAALLVSRALLPHSHIAAKLALQIGDFAGFPDWGYARLFYNKLSQTVISYMLCFPFVVTFSLLARAALANTVARIYAGDGVSWQKIIPAFPNLWKRLAVTYTWAGVVILGSNAVILALIFAVMKAVPLLGFDSKWEVGAALVAGIVYSIVFANAMIVCNLGTIVCVVEECNYGRNGVLRALFLIRGKTRIALLISVILNLSCAFVESLFAYRVMGMSRNLSTLFAWEWEAPVLVFIYSILGVMEIVMSSVFYYTCKSSRLEDCIRSLPNPSQNIEKKGTAECCNVFNL